MFLDDWRETAAQIRKEIEAGIINISVIRSFMISIESSKMPPKLDEHEVMMIEMDNRLNRKAKQRYAKEQAKEALKNKNS